jgi:nucleotide-binding universal stress UspA family protein
MNGPVLVGIDIGSETPHILETALSFASKLDETLVLVHVVEPIEDPAEADQDTRQFHEELIAKARRHIDQAISLWPEGTRATILVELGHRAHVLLRLIQEHSPSVLVLGASSQPGVGLQVLFQAPCPVLTVPSRVAATA